MLKWHLTTLALLLVGYTSGVGQERLQGSAVILGPLQADVSRQVVLSALPEVTPGQLPPFRLPRPQNGLTDEQWRHLKSEAAKMPALSRPEDSAAWPGLSPALQEKELPPLTPSASVDFLAQTQSCGGTYPSDMGLAVNDTWVIQTVNTCIAVYDKNGVLQVGFPKSLNALLGWPGGTFTFDPRATYDWVTGHFIVTAATCSNVGCGGANNAGYFNVAASATSDPRGSWHVYHIAVGGTNWPDFPTLGQNWASDPYDGAIYVCANIFTSPGFSFVGARCLFLPKASIYAGTGINYYSANNLKVGSTLVDTVQPVNVYEIGAKPRAEFAVNSFNINSGGGQCRSGCNGLVVWAFANTLVQPGSPGPVISSVVVATPSNYSLPANADQPGSNNSIDTGDTRITDMVQYSGGLLYATLNTGNGGTSAILGWTVKPYLDDNGGGCTGSFTNACPRITSATIQQEYCAWCGWAHKGAGYYGTIQPVPENNWTMVYNFSANGQNGGQYNYSPGTVYTSVRVTWQPFHDGGTFACQNNTSYSEGRWGDYTATAIGCTGCATPTTWFSGMYVQSNHQWGTCVAANKFVNVTDP